MSDGTHPSPSEVTRLLSDVRRGDGAAAERLWRLVYEELRELARRKMAREQPGQTLQPTALVHEAFLRLVGPDGSEPPWRNRAHFFGAAATAMRRILIERARRERRLRHGGDRRRTPLSQVMLAESGREVGLLDLDAALEKLEAIDEPKAALVTLRYLLGCTIEETAEAMGVSPAKVKKDWTFTKAWLHRELEGA